MITDKTLVEACIRQERAAQYELYNRFSGKLFAIALRYCKCKEEAQDVLQIAFLKIYQNLEKFRFDCPLEAWLKRVTINTSIRHIQSSKKMESLESIEFGNAEFTVYENDALMNLQVEDIHKILDSLPEGCRVIFQMFAIDGYKHKEIAEILNVSEGTSKSQFARARDLIAKRIEKKSEHNTLNKVSNESVF
ncbi:MAG: RNA polymerase sigma factor [Leadbetterella sp.]